MNMETNSKPAGVIESLGAGFNIVAQQPLLLLIPVILDLFLWLGPRLSIQPVAEQLTTRMDAIAAEATGSSAALFEHGISEILGSYNLFSALSTWPLGIPSLLAGGEADATPLGQPSFIQVQTVGQLALYMLGLTLLGLLLGTLYLMLVGRRSAASGQVMSSWPRRIGVSWVRIILLIAVMLTGAFMAGIPFFLMVEVASMALQPLVPLMLLSGAAIGFWALLHLFFCIHAILVEGMGIKEAITRSAVVVQRHRLSAVALLLSVVVINLGLGAIWHLPPSQSWMRLLAIAGNAFISTGLAAATFVYYQEHVTG
jgi:hypothetical protein